MNLTSFNIKADIRDSKFLAMVIQNTTNAFIFALPAMAVGHALGLSAPVYRSNFRSQHN
jgi:hypothetical protein